MKAPALRSKRASRRDERVAKALSTPPRPASSVLDPIDEQIASLLESVSSKHEAQPAAVEPDVRPDRVAAREGLSAIALPETLRPRRRARSTQTRTARRPDRFSETVSSYTVKSAFAIVLYSIAVGLLIFYLMSDLGRPLGG